MKILNKAAFKRIWKVIEATFMGFINNNGLKLSASLAYYTVFSIAPLIIMIISLTSLVLGHHDFNDALYAQMRLFVGKEAVIQLHGIVKNLQLSGKTGVALVTGIIILLIGASSMFIDIQDSLNIIWRVKAKPKKGWLKLIQNRFLSFSLVISLGFLLLVSLIVNLAIKALSTRLGHFFPDVTVTLFSLVNLAITLLVIATLFGIIFKFLPDAKIRWRDVRAGALFTALLFMLGQYFIGLYIQYTAQGSAYGAAGSIIVVLIWIYYSSTILYIGAEFTQVYAEARGSRIEPAEYAVHVRQTEVKRVGKLHSRHPKSEGYLKK